MFQKLTIIAGVLIATLGAEVATATPYFRLMKQELYALETACGVPHLYPQVANVDVVPHVEQLTADHFAVVGSRIEALKAQGCSQQKVAGSGQGSNPEDTIFIDVSTEDAEYLVALVELGDGKARILDRATCIKKGFASPAEISKGKVCVESKYP